MKLKVLCICTMGLNRSKYLAEYLAKKGYNTRYGGIGPCRVDAEPANPVNPKDLEWADIIVVARKKHKIILENNFEIKNKKILALEVSDSRKKATEINPKFKNIGHEEFNKIWTYPKLREAIESYLPFEEFEK